MLFLYALLRRCGVQLVVLLGLSFLAFHDFQQIGLAQFILILAIIVLVATTLSTAYLWPEIKPRYVREREAADRRDP